MRRLARIFVLGLVVVCCPRIVAAEIITFSSEIGSGAFDFQHVFTNDNDVALLPFTVNEAGTTFSLQTSSFANGGFDPYLVILSVSLDPLNRSLSLAQWEDPNVPGATFHAISTDIDGENWDDTLSLTMNAGSYLLAVMQFPNEFTGFTDVDGVLVPTFSRDDAPNFTFDIYRDAFPELFEGVASCGFLHQLPSGEFDCRQGEFAMAGALTSPQPPPPPPAGVPEPGTLSLLGIGAIGAVLRNTLRRRRTPS